MAHQRILVVDDEPDIVNMLAHILRPEGYEVLLAYDGISAIDMALQQKPDLILLDLMMPGISGYEACELLKANPATENIPVLCISSAHTSTARTQCLNAGAVSLLLKPFPPMELVAQVQRYLPLAS